MLLFCVSQGCVLSGSLIPDHLPLDQVEWYSSYNLTYLTLLAQPIILTCLRHLAFPTFLTHLTYLTHLAQLHKKTHLNRLTSLSTFDPSDPSEQSESIDPCHKSGQSEQSDPSYIFSYHLTQLTHQTLTPTFALTIPLCIIDTKINCLQPLFESFPEPIFS